MWAVFIFLGCRFRSRWQALSEEEMADCARGRSVRYLRVQLKAVLKYGTSNMVLVLWSKIESNDKIWYLRVQLNAILASCS